MCLPGCCGGPNEKKLLSFLLDKYNTLERPVTNESEPVVVSFGLTLQQIIDVVSIIDLHSPIVFYFDHSCRIRNGQSCLGMQFAQPLAQLVKYT